MSDKFHTDYVYLLEKFGAKRICHRYVKLKTKIHAFLYQFNFLDFTYINQNLLWQAIVDYFSDIARFKDFHEIERANEDKIWSYLSYWLIRRKPIQVKNFARKDMRDEEMYDYLNENLIFINEKFAFCQLLKHIHYDCHMVFEESLWDKVEEFKMNFTYYLKYRMCDKQGIELALCMFKTGTFVNFADHTHHAE